MQLLRTFSVFVCAYLASGMIVMICASALMQVWPPSDPARAVAFPQALAMAVGLGFGLWAAIHYHRRKLALRQDPARHPDSRDDSR
jgi:hypothetical protein